ncbi:hypothetical protein C7G98_18860, partial [Acinetobacter baumannii]
MGIFGQRVIWERSEKESERLNRQRLTTVLLYKEASAWGTRDKIDEMGKAQPPHLIPTGHSSELGVCIDGGPVHIDD